MDVSPISNTYINGEEQLRVLDEILSWVGELREKVSNALEKTDMKTYLRDVEVLNENET